MRLLIVAATLLLGVAAQAGEGNPEYLLPDRRAPLIYPDNPKLPPYYEGQQPAYVEPEIINPQHQRYAAPPLPYNPPPQARQPDPYYYDRYEDYRKPDYRYYEPYYDEREYRAYKAYRKERRKEKFRKFIDKAHIVLDILGRFVAQ